MSIDPSSLDPGSFAFFGYPSRPQVGRDALFNAATAIQTAGASQTLTWEQLDVSGRLIIGRITTAIDRASVSVFDVTTLNQNVMFEIGYAIGADRQLWLVRDPSDVAGERLWREVGVLRPIGYTAYENSHDLSASFLSDRPDQRPTTFYQESIEPTLDPRTDPSVFCRETQPQYRACRPPSGRADSGERGRSALAVLRLDGSLSRGA
jgi:hypothetical protein